MYRFGDFTFDPQSGDLITPRSTTRLQPQAAAVLTMLLQRAGSVVMRTELQRHVWPDTTVEFNDGLNTCVRQLRVALDDDASAPRFIETLPRRGYRFLPKVTRLDDVTSRDSIREPLENAASARTPPSFPRRLLGLAAIGAVAVGAVIVLPGLRTPSRTPAVSLAILPFAVDTTDTLMVKYQQGLTAQMLEGAKGEPGWRLVDKKDATHLLSGSLKREGVTVRIFAELVLADDKRHLWAEDIVDTYPFAGNSKVMGDRIEKSAARALSSPR